MKKDKKIDMEPFTPGPWYAVGYSGYFSLQTQPYYGSEYDILNLEVRYRAKENAQLAASAPILYNSLKTIIEAYKSEKSISAFDMDKAIMALNDATK